MHTIARQFNAVELTAAAEVNMTANIRGQINDGFPMWARARERRMCGRKCEWLPGCGFARIAQRSPSGEILNINFANMSNVSSGKISIFNRISKESKHHLTRKRRHRCPKSTHFFFAIEEVNNSAFVLAILSRFASTRWMPKRETWFSIIDFFFFLLYEYGIKSRLHENRMSCRNECDCAGSAAARHMTHRTIIVDIILHSCRWHLWHFHPLSAAALSLQ